MSKNLYNKFFCSIMKQCVVRLNISCTANDARAKELVAMQNYSDYLKTGTHSGAGAYVSAADLNL